MTRSSSQSMRRRIAAFVAAPALGVTALVALPTAPAVAAEPDPAPLTAGTTWLKSQLTDGLVHNDQYDFDDYGLSIDFGLALAEAGGQDTAVDQISSAVQAKITGYVGDGQTESYAGSVAKAATFASVAGDDPRAYGGTDLVATLEERVLDGGPAAGRIQDKSEFGDFANSLGQAFAVQALDAAGSSEADAATDFLLLQQCEEGFFRQDFAEADAAAQACDDAADAKPSTDATALAVLALQGQKDDEDVQEALADATSWLVDEQLSSGAFGAGSDIPTPNANSTGLAGRALVALGRTEEATRAAVFVRALQVDEPAACATELQDDAGAVAYDGAAQRAGRADGITVETQDQWRRASAQAVPLLSLTPAAEATEGSPEPVTSGRYHKAGSRVIVTGAGFAPGDTVCFTLGNRGITLTPADHDGRASAWVRLPKGTAVRTFSSTSGDVEGAVLSFAVLDRERLTASAKRNQVRRGGTQVLRLRGLAPGEQYRVKYRGKVRKRGTVNANGARNVRFKVGRKAGKVKVVAIGQFGNRRGNDTFRVRR